MIATALAFLLLFAQEPSFVQPGGVTGALRTVDGIPAVAVRVVAMPVPRGTTLPDDGPNYFNLAPPTGVALTDNEGLFTFLDLAPGRYYLMAGVSGQATFYPGADDVRGAGVIDVISGELVEGLDFSLAHRFGGKLSGNVKADMAALGPRTATITGGKLADLLEVPVDSNGEFTFGHVPPGNYLLSLYPPTPGIASMPVKLEDADISGLELIPLPTNTVSGRISVRNGPIPRGILGFYTTRTYVGGTINPDGTFKVELHDARHQIDFAGLPVGYSLASVRVGGQEAPDGIVVNGAPINNVVITVNAPRHLAVLRGRVTGLATDRYSSTLVQMSGPTFNVLQADIQTDGTFEFPAVTPGLYRLTLSGVPELRPQTVVLDSFGTFEVSVAVPVP